MPCSDPTSLIHYDELVSPLRRDDSICTKRVLVRASKLYYFPPGLFLFSLSCCPTCSVLSWMCTVTRPCRLFLLTTLISFLCFALETPLTRLKHPVKMSICLGIGRILLRRFVIVRIAIPTICARPELLFLASPTTSLPHCIFGPWRNR